MVSVWSVVADSALGEVLSDSVASCVLVLDGFDLALCLGGMCGFAVFFLADGLVSLLGRETSFLSVE